MHGETDCSNWKVMGAVLVAKSWHGRCHNDRFVWMFTGVTRSGLLIPHSDVGVVKRQVWPDWLVMCFLLAYCLTRMHWLKLKVTISQGFAPNGSAPIFRLQWGDFGWKASKPYYPIWEFCHVACVHVGSAVVAWQIRKQTWQGSRFKSTTLPVSYVSLRYLWIRSFLFLRLRFWTFLPLFLDWSRTRYCQHNNTVP